MRTSEGRYSSEADKIQLECKRRGRSKVEIEDE